MFLFFIFLPRKSKSIREGLPYLFRGSNNLFITHEKGCYPFTPVLSDRFMQGILCLTRHCRVRKGVRCVLFYIHSKVFSYKMVMIRILAACDSLYTPRYRYSCLESFKGYSTRSTVINILYVKIFSQKINSPAFCKTKSKQNNQKNVNT